MKIRKFSEILSAAVILFSVGLYFFKSPYWYYSGVYGVWLLFDNLSHRVGNKTTLDILLKKQYAKFVLLYVLLFVVGFSIEYMGRTLLGFWVYPLVPSLIMNTIGLAGYPFILMSFKESFELARKVVKNQYAAVISSMIINIAIWEIPNVYSGDWAYRIPFVDIAFFGVNLVVVFGWIILIAVPIFVYYLTDKLAKLF